MTDYTHPSLAPSEKLLSDCTLRRQRRSGPGGQHRNKVETAVVLTHTPSGITAQASERRSQRENKQVALFRLRIQLALQIRSPWTLEHAALCCPDMRPGISQATAANNPNTNVENAQEKNGESQQDSESQASHFPPVSSLWLSRCQGQRLQINPSHEDFPALLAEALDSITASGWNIQQAAKHLQISTSQLVKFLQLESQAVAQINSQRKQLGLKPLK